MVIGNFFYRDPVSFKIPEDPVVGNYLGGNIPSASGNGRDPEIYFRERNIPSTGEKGRHPE
jgi:hypothetical protein